MKNNPLQKFIDSFRDWAAALESIDGDNSSKKLVIIDEFQYMAYGNKAIPSLLQKLWDEILRHRNVMLILCGSAMSFIEKELLASKNPLYGRATGILCINEFSFDEARKFLPGYNSVDAVSAYSILGGVPHYLKQFSPAENLATNIERAILSRGSILYSEAEFLLKQELRQTSLYNAIIQAVAAGKTKLNEIHQFTQLDRATASVYLKNLCDLNIISRELPVSAPNSDVANVQRGLYRLSDNYFRFWYKFVFPNRSDLESNNAAFVWENDIKIHLNEFISETYEKICIDYLRKQNVNGNLPFRFKKIGRWWDKNTEIDIVATGDKNRCIVGECKWRNEKISVAVLTVLEAKATALKSQIQGYYLFSKSGFTQSLIAVAAERAEVHLVGLGELDAAGCRN